VLGVFGCGGEGELVTHGALLAIVEDTTEEGA